MPRFCANLSYLFTDLPMTERPGAARAAGFEAVEILFPYEGDAAALRWALDAAGLPLALINCPPPNYANPDGPRGFAAMPTEADRFRSAFRRALRYAKVLGAGRIHVMAGTALGNSARQTFVDNLRWAAETAGDLPLTIEPLNRVDMPGYFLGDFETARDVIEAVGAATLGLQFDAYHAQLITGDVLAAWGAVADLVTHVQIADAPGRGAPGTGDIDFAELFARIEATGYEGWISAEYRPEGATADSLGWLTAD